MGINKTGLKEGTVTQVGWAASCVLCISASHVMFDTGCGHVR